MAVDNLTSKAEILGRMIPLLSELYHDENLKPAQRAFLETVIGAGIFYISSSKILFNGKISKAALEKVKNGDNVKLVKEHAFPRKVAGRRLFTDDLKYIIAGEKTFKELFMEVYGRYNLVLQEENQRLKQFQKTDVFISEDEAYKSAGIVLVELKDEDYELKKLKSFQNKIVNEVIADSQEEIDNELEEVLEQLIDGEEAQLEFSLLDGQDKNHSALYERFLKFVIDNFRDEIENNIILKKFFSRDVDDEMFSASRKYNRIKNYNGWAYNTHADTARKKKSMNIISQELQIKLLA